MGTVFKGKYLYTSATEFPMVEEGEIPVAVLLDGDEDDGSKAETVYLSLCNNPLFPQWLGKRNKKGLYAACKKVVVNVDFRPWAFDGARKVGRPLKMFKDSDIEAFDAAKKHCANSLIWFLFTLEDTDGGTEEEAEEAREQEEWDAEDPEEDGGEGTDPP